MNRQHIEVSIDEKEMLMLLQVLPGLPTGITLKQVCSGIGIKTTVKINEKEYDITNYEAW